MALIMKKIFFLWLVALLPAAVGAQALPDTVRRAIGNYLMGFASRTVRTSNIRVDSVSVTGHTLTILAINFDDYPIRESNIPIIYNGIRQLLPPSFARYKLQLLAGPDRLPLEQFIPQALRSKPDKKEKHFTPNNGKTPPLVTRLSRLFTPTHGLLNRHIALWQSHGRYYEQKLSRWEWQRARLMQTVEDLYTQSYVLPFLVPMLESAGANVLLPRERDTRREEVVVDNDTIFFRNSIYSELEGDNHWSQGDSTGFAQRRARYINFENPFREGTYRTTRTIRKGTESTATWVPDIPVAGDYAVYISYHSLPQSTTDALYTVYHTGGETQFRVNQQMGGGTWIYLGTFRFAAGKSSCRVTLTNRSSKAGRILTADAIKFGGGMGNIARRVSDDAIVTENIRSDQQTSEQLIVLPELNYPYEVSGDPRYCEAARYWLQWAGMPDSIYSESKGHNDYTDDYRARGLWVNYLAGGSAAYPEGGGLHIPVDMALAFHSDAGTTKTDSIVGTLGIYFTNAYGGTFAGGASRYRSHDLVDLIQSNIVNDIRALYDPHWTRRGKWNSSYNEARIPRVPTMLLELLSHQNFADMRYGLDPSFRFTVSRAVYKGILRFLCSQYGTPYVVQPLGVDHLALRMSGEREVALTWRPRIDRLEPTATAERYIVYTRIGDGDFDNGTLVSDTIYHTSIPAGVICSYRVTAVNSGGESFPSETLSVGRALNARSTILVVNGFDRISAPADFVMPAPLDTLYAGFLDNIDRGVPYIKDISYVGSQKEFNRSIPWMDDDASGYGDSFGNYEDMVIAGNTFDYPAVHGAAILKNGYSFVSCSDEAVEAGIIRLTDYPIVDLILGKEAQAKTGRGGIIPLRYKTFTLPMQNAISDFCNQGGYFFTSGAYVATDLWNHPLVASVEADRKFLTDVLKIKWRANQASVAGRVKCVVSPTYSNHCEISYYNEPNDTCYAVESPDGIEPADNTPDAHTVMRYSENNLSAGVSYRDATYRTFVLGFPLETVRTAADRTELMKIILDFFEKE
ncbi:MAG: xanthan lyase [Prevotellaceae bacterium]|jgi:hypothetical protein|nr:xanthan lyase [Prevotellaceae bacterium]